jgi:hypothetical protein
MKRDTMKPFPQPTLLTLAQGAAPLAVRDSFGH